MRKIILICLIIIVLVRCLFGIYVKEKYTYIPNEEKEYIKFEYHSITGGMRAPKPLPKRILQKISWLTAGPFLLHYFTTKTQPTTKSEFVIFTNGDLYMLEEYLEKENTIIKKYLKTLSIQELEEIGKKIEKEGSTIVIDGLIITFKGKKYTFRGVSAYKLLEKYISFE